jgi:TonB family protein
VLAMLGGLHIGLFLAFESAMYRPPSSVDSSESLITVFIRPRIREAGEPLSAVDSTSLQVHVDPRLTGSLAAPAAMDFAVDRNDAAAMVAPTLQGDGHSGIQPYLQQAGLMRGTGATVVLRIEVLASGDPGRIEVDASSGNMQIDQAAMSYARIQHWYAGRVNGAPHPMWIRWGIRLQA